MNKITIHAKYKIDDIVNIDTMGTVAKVKVVNVHYQTKTNQCYYDLEFVNKVLQEQYQGFEKVREHKLTQ